MGITPLSYKKKKPFSEENGFGQANK